MVEITNDREDKQPFNIEIGEDSLANEMGVESIAVWNVLVGLITLKEAINTSDATNIDTSAEGHGGDISPNGGSTPMFLRRHQGSNMSIRSSHQDTTHIQA